MKATSPLCTLAVLLPLAACAPSLVDQEATDTPLDDTRAPGAITVEDSRHGLTLSRVDASSNEVWIYLDLDSGTQVHPTDPLDDVVWDLAFQRYVIAVNGGVSGAGGVAAAVVPDTTVETLAQAPANGYLTDEADSDADENTDPDRVFDPWYSYDPQTHILTPAPLVFVVETTDGGYVKVGMDGYYSDAGDSGYPSFWWGDVPAP